MKTYIKLFVFAFLSMLIAAGFGHLNMGGFCAAFIAAAVGFIIGGVANWTLEGVRQ